VKRGRSDKERRSRGGGAESGEREERLRTADENGEQLIARMRNTSLKETRWPASICEANEEGIGDSDLPHSNPARGKSRGSSRISDTCWYHGNRGARRSREKSNGEHS